MDGVFITATDTEVGKTTVAAGLLKVLAEPKNAAYWKPVQTGTIIGDDTRDVQELTNLTDQHILEPCYRFADPVAPWVAAKKWNKEIQMETLVDYARTQTRLGKFLIAEGAGGLLVPMNRDSLLLDLVKELAFPVLVISKDTLGTINQTLLTIRALKQEGLEVLGVVFTHSEGQSLGNVECIEHYGKVPVLENLKKSVDRKQSVADVVCSESIRKLFGVPGVPIP